MTVCFCFEAVDPTQDFQLKCGCLVHRNCLVQYLRAKLGDKAAVLSTSEGLNRFCVSCPYAVAGTCKSAEVINAISMATLEQLAVHSGAPNSDEILSHEEIARVRRWLDEVPESNQSNSSSVGAAADSSDLYIRATTKPCPSCGLRVTHWHGHSCHHIQPSGGCPKCKVPFCYKCLESGTCNQRLRGAPSSCRCGGWSNFCSTTNIHKNLIVAPYPHDVVRIFSIFF